MYDKEHYSLFNQAEGLLDYLISVYSKIIYEEKKNPQSDRELISRLIEERSDIQDDADLLSPSTPTHSIDVIQRYSQHPYAPKKRNQPHES